jgi:hypothetical protein
VKKLAVVFVIFALGVMVGCAFGPGFPNVVSASPAPAQATPTPSSTPVLFATPGLICGGTHNCGQYIVEVSTQRGFGPAFIVYSVTNQANVVDTSNCCSQVTSGFPSVSLQALEPSPRDSQTFTLTVGEP